ncbi:MAG: hypothetical protein HYW25_01370 [Candidatus Aenigmarchaeota archaeon]|nr:hypothetical protein [Candidatus Aenigmarchaeota archaeon]
MSVLMEKGRHETSYVVISKDEYESMQRTIEILGDKELMEQIKESKTSKGRPWKEVRKELGL